MRHISEFRVWGCAIEAKLPPITTKALDYRTESGYYLNTTGTKAVIRYWDPNNPDEIGYCTTARLYEHKTYEKINMVSSKSEHMKIIFFNLKTPL